MANTKRKTVKRSKPSKLQMTTVEAQKLLQSLEKRREKVLSPRTLKFLKNVSSDAQASREFLRKAGIYDKKGRVKYTD